MAANCDKDVAYEQHIAYSARKTARQEFSVQKNATTRETVTTPEFGRRQFWG